MDRTAQSTLDADTAGCLSRDLNHQVGSAAVVFGFRVATPKHSSFFRSCLWSRVWHLEILLSIALSVANRRLQ